MKSKKEDKVSKECVDSKYKTIGDSNAIESIRLVKKCAKTERFIEKIAPEPNRIYMLIGVCVSQSSYSFENGTRAAQNCLLRFRTSFQTRSSFYSALIKHHDKAHIFHRHRQN